MRTIARRGALALATLALVGGATVATTSQAQAATLGTHPYTVGVNWCAATLNFTRVASGNNTASGSFHVDAWPDTDRECRFWLERTSDSGQTWTTKDYETIWTIPAVQETDTGNYADGAAYYMRVCTQAVSVWAGVTSKSGTVCTGWH